MTDRAADLSFRDAGAGYVIADMTPEEFEREFAEAAEYWAGVPEAHLSDADLKILAAVHGDQDDPDVDDDVEPVPPADTADDPRIPF